MGFRGEALASIAAIANVELVSKTADQQVGYKVVVQGGDILSKEEQACPNGTTITVKNLFFNTPVRYKFLKKDFTETGYIEDVVTRTALINPNIAIKLINSGKTIIQTNGNGDLKTVVYSIYGKDTAEKILNVDYEYEGMKVTGVVGKSEIARSNRAYQMFFVNKRYVKDKTLMQATEQAFKGMLPIGKFAFLVLNLELDANKVDVNVHPAKLEVRFEDEQAVFKAIYHAIKDALLREGLLSEESKKVETPIFNANPYNVSRSSQSSIEKLRKAIKELQSTYSTSEKDALQTSFNALEKMYSETSTPKEGAVDENAKLLESESPKIEEQQVENEGLKNEEQLAENSNIASNEELSKNGEIQDDIKFAENANSEVEYNMEDTNIIEQIFKEKNGFAVANENTIPYKLDELNPANAEISASNSDEAKENKSLDSNDLKSAKVDFAEMYKKTFGIDLSKIKEEVEEEKDIDLMNSNLSIFDRIDEYKKPKYKFIGIVFNTYIILEIDNEMYIMDQHAAHERVMYEKVKKNYYSDNGAKNTQLLLLPDIITLSHKEMAIAKENMDVFEKAGFIVEEFGENTIKLSGVPDLCIDLETKELFLETLDEINQVARTAKQEIEERFIATVACKAAVKANMVLSKEQVDSLMNELLKLPNPFTCPHGRPTVIKMSKYDIERKFARK
jgi:DNA mismatch repair protein MutL